MGTQPSKYCSSVDLPVLELKSSEIAIATACNHIFMVLIPAKRHRMQFWNLF